MGRRFAELAFTPAIKAQQIKHGSRTIYERVEQSHDLGDRLGPAARTISLPGASIPILDIVYKALS